MRPIHSAEDADVDQSAETPASKSELTERISIESAPPSEKIDRQSSVSSELRDTDLDCEDDDEMEGESHHQSISMSIDQVPDGLDATQEPKEPELIAGQNISYLEHIKSFSKNPATGGECNLKEAVVLGAGSYRSVTLIQSLVKVFDKVYCIGPLSIKKKLCAIPNVELIEGNVWEPKFGEEAQRSRGLEESPGTNFRSFRSPSNIMGSFFKPSSPSKSPFSTIPESNTTSVGPRWDFLCQRVSHIYVSYGCFGIVSQKEFMSIDLRSHIERKVHAVIMNALEMGATGRAKRIVVYTHLNSQLATCTSSGLITEANYSTLDQLIGCERQIDSELNDRAHYTHSSLQASSPIPSPLPSPVSTATTNYGGGMKWDCSCSPCHRRLASGLARSNMYYVLAWIDLILEASFMYVRDIKGYDAVIFRLPCDLIGTGDIVVVRKHVCWTFIDVLISIGLFPVDLITETILGNGTLHPLDEIMRDTVAFSLDSECYPIYQFIRKSELISIQDCLNSFKRIGIMHLSECTTPEFQQALKITEGLSPLHLRSATDLLEYLEYPCKMIKQFSTTLYDHDRRRVLRNTSGPGSGARLQNLYAKVLPRFSVNRTLDTCLLALLKRGHLKMTDLPCFGDIVDFSGARSILHKSCVCGKLKGCDCSRMNLLETMDNGWSRILQESREQWLARPDVENFSKHLALCRLAALSVNTLCNMCRYESTESSNGGGRLGDTEGNDDIGNPVELHRASTARQMYVFGTGVDLLLNLIDIDKRVAVEGKTGLMSGSVQSSSNGGGVVQNSRPIHVVQNFELLNLYGYSVPVRPYRISIGSGSRADPRAGELGAMKTLCAIAGLDISCSQICPLSLLGRSPQLAMDYNLPKALKYYTTEIGEGGEILNSICSFQNRLHNHMSLQYRDITTWIYSYDLQFASVSPLMNFSLKDTLSLKPSCVIIHRQIIDVLRTNYTESLSEYLKISLGHWTDFEDHMAIQFARDHPNLQPPRHFAIPILYEDLVNKPHLTINTFLTKLIHPPMPTQSSNVISEIYERYLSSPIAAQKRDNNTQKNVLPVALEKQTSINFAFYHVRWHNNIPKCQTESIIWQRMNNNCMETNDYYDEQGKIKIIL